MVSTTITVQKDAGIGVFERLCVLLAVVTDYVVSGVSTAIVVYICNVVVYAIVVIVSLTVDIVSIFLFLRDRTLLII